MFEKVHDLRPSTLTEVIVLVVATIAIFAICHYVLPEVKIKKNQRKEGVK